MKINQLGTFAIAIVGVVVVSFTAACGGSPTTPSAAIPSIGNGALAESVNLSGVKSVTDQICTQTPAYGETDQSGEAPNADTPPVTCDSPAAADQPQADVVVNDGPSLGEISLAHRRR